MIFLFLLKDNGDFNNNACCSVNINTLEACIAINEVLDLIFSEIFSVQITKSKKMQFR